MTNGHDALASRAPAVAALFSQILGLPSPGKDDPAIAEFAEQFSLDVSSLDANQRDAFLTATGEQAFAVVQQIYAADFGPRVRSALDAVFGPSDWPTSDTYAGDSWALLESYMTAVARLQVLDATTTELIRLRGARLHACAVCMSRRSQDAIDQGANDVSFAAVDDWPSSDFSASTKAALGLVDAMIQTPFAIPSETAAAVRENLSEAEAVEVVLDVMRNAANKIAVALGADAASITDGVELFRTDSEGNLAVIGQR